MVVRLTLLGTLSLAGIARACPICDSDRGAQVRAGVFEDFDPTTAAAVGLPFVIVAGVVAFVGLEPGRRKP